MKALPVGETSVNTYRLSAVLCLPKPESFQGRLTSHLAVSCRQKKILIQETAKLWGAHSRETSLTGTTPSCVALCSFRNTVLADVPCRSDYSGIL